MPITAVDTDKPASESDPYYEDRVNFPPRQIGPVRSECLVTGFHREDGAVILAGPDNHAPNGAKLA